MIWRWTSSQACVALLALPIGLLNLVSAEIAYTAPDGTTKRVDDDLLWGPYKPNLYLGIRPRVPKGLITGLLWSRVDDYATPQQSELPRALCSLFEKPS